MRMPRNPRMTRQPSERDPSLTLHRQTPIDQIARLRAESNVALAALHATTGSSIRRGRERVFPREEDVQEYAEGPDLGGEHGVGFAGKDFGSGIGPSAVEPTCEEAQRWSDSLRYGSEEGKSCTTHGQLVPEGVLAG